MLFSHLKKYKSDVKRLSDVTSYRFAEGCGGSNIFGQNHNRKDGTVDKGIFFNSFYGRTSSMQSVIMAIRPNNFDGEAENNENNRY